MDQILLKAKQLYHRHTLDVYLASALAVIFSFLYGITASTTNVGYADGAEALVIAKNLSVMHPPGVPLYLTLLYGMLSLPTLTSPAFMGALLSILLSAVAIVCLYATARILTHTHTGKPRGFVLINPRFQQRFIAITSTALIASTPLYWRYSHVTNSHVFSYLLMSVFLLVFTLLSSLKHPPKMYRFLLYALGATVAISVTHQPLLIIMLIPVAWHLYQHQKVVNQNFLVNFAITVGVSLAIPIGLLFYAQSKNNPFSWPINPSFEGYWAYLSQSDITGYLTQNNLFSTPHRLNQDINAIIDSLIGFGKHLVTWFSPLLILLYLLGIMSAVFKHRRQAAPLVLTSLVFLIIIPAIIQFSPEWSSLAANQPLYVIAIIPTLLGIVWGLQTLISRVGAFIRVYLNHFLAALLIIASIWLPSIIGVYRSKDGLNLRNYHVLNQRYKHMLTNVNENALIMCYSDTSCFSLLYLHKLEGVRPDITIIPQAIPYVYQSIIQDPSLVKFAYEGNPFLSFDIIAHNLGSRPVYAVELGDQDYQALGIEYPYLYYIPQGYYGELSKQLPETIPTYTDTSTNDWADQPVVWWDATRLVHKTLPAKDHLLNGLLYSFMNLKIRSLEEYNHASKIYYEYSDAEKEQFNRLRPNLEQASTKPLFKPGSKIRSAQALLALKDNLLIVGKNGQAYQAAIAAAFSEPDNLEVHLALMDIYNRMGDDYFEALEATNVLILDPDNASASARLNQLLQNTP